MIKRLKTFIIPTFLIIVSILTFQETACAHTNQVYSKKSCNKIAYITIDDGPSKHTDELLNILNKYNVKATFFMIDRNMRLYPQQVRNIIDCGHSAGLHSVSHDINKLYEEDTSAKEEFDANNKTFHEITGKNTKLVRLPYGSKPYMPEKSYETLVEANYKIWDWTIDTQDWKVTSDKIIDNIKVNSRNKENIVILMHEKKQTVQSLEAVLKYLIDEGYEFLPIRQDEAPRNYWVVG